MTISRIGNRKKSRHVEPQRTFSAAFTLVELILVLALLSLVAALAQPLFQRTYYSLALEESAHALARSVDWARENAIVQRTPFLLKLDAQASFFQIVPKSEGDFKALADSFSRKRTLPPGIRLRTESENVLFYPNGMCDPTLIVLSNPAGETVKLILQEMTASAKISKG